MAGRSPQRGQDLPPVKKEQSKEVQEANADAMRRRQRAQGYQSTVIARNMIDQNNPGLKAYFGS
jgi:hypothetical protein